MVTREVGESREEKLTSGGDIQLEGSQALRCKDYVVLMYIIFMLYVSVKINLKT